MRVLVFHGYVLRGTGSNVYNANLATAFVRLGHEVHLLAQEPEAASLPWVDAVGGWDAGRLAVEVLREPVRCTVYRPDIGGLLPVYVADRYDGVEARPFNELDDTELDRYLRANVAAVGEVAVRARPGVALANHLVMGPVILARGLAASGTPYAAKVHGSALEYTVVPYPRFLPYAEEGIAGARGVLVGSRHTAERLWATIPDPGLPERTRLGPPGVDTHTFAPREADRAAAGLAALSARLARKTRGTEPAGDSAFARDTGEAARALSRLDPAGGDRLVAYVGKLIVSKGVDLLVAGWPLVLDRVPAAMLVVVGFGAYRGALERLVAALATGDLPAARALAAEGRAAEGGPAGELPLLAAFLDGLAGDERERYLAAAAAMGEHVVFTGRLEHGELADLLPACEAEVVPSTFPEAFGMVAAEAAACGVLPVSAAHSGLAEVTAMLAPALPVEARGLLSFGLGDDPVRGIATRIVAWLEAPAELRAATRAALADVARRRFAWEGVAEGVIAAAEGRLDDLPAPAVPEAGGGPHSRPALG